MFLLQFHINLRAQLNHDTSSTFFPPISCSQPLLCWLKHLLPGQGALTKRPTRNKSLPEPKAAHLTKSPNSQLSYSSSCTGLFQGISTSRELQWLFAIKSRKFRLCLTFSISDLDLYYEATLKCYKEHSIIYTIVESQQTSSLARIMLHWMYLHLIL